MWRAIVNLTAYNVGWFACVLGGAQGTPGLAVLTTTIVVMVHLLMVNRLAPALVLLAAVGCLGTLVDSIQMHLGVIVFPGRADALLVPIWFTALWVSFATLLNISMRWMQRQLWLAALFGLLGGPAAYLAGAKLGAIELHSNSTLAMFAVGIEWMILMPVMAALSRKLYATGLHSDTKGQTGATAIPGGGESIS